MKPKVLIRFSLMIFLILSNEGRAVVKKLPVIKSSTKCETLLSKDITSSIGYKTHITTAKEIPDEMTKQVYCDVTGFVEPSINFEIKLPVNNWTQRFVQIGCGGMCGMISLRPLENVETCLPANNGEIVLAATDMGHSGGMGSSEWARNLPLRIDFAHLGQHVTSLVTKAVINNYYGHEPKFSYFVGCSDGGREALMEVQRYPKDFDGVIAGAAAMNFTTQNSFYHGWNALINLDEKGNNILTAEKLPLLHNAVLNSCDDLDGVKDGVINLPWECHFDANKILCNPDQDENQCLTKEQVRVVNEIYKGAHDSNGSKLVISGPLYGSELIWADVVIPNKGQQSRGYSIALSTVRDVLYKGPLAENFKLINLKFDQETFYSITQLHELYDATDPNIKDFANRGGKLLLWHGLSDTDISPYNTIAYYHALENTLGRDKIKNVSRLYLLPGVGHCGRGDGPSNVEFLTAMMNWVENGVAPEKLTATLKEGGHFPMPPMGEIVNGQLPPMMKITPKGPSKILRSRPLYPYPFVTEYKGKGSTDKEVNFRKGKAQPLTQTSLNWLGSGFFQSPKKVEHE
jgi:hypothetical protein